MSNSVLLQPSQHTFLVNGGDSLLEAGLRAGLAMNYGCSSGNCGLCKARIVSGEVDKIRHQDYVVSEAEKNQGYVLLCSHTAASDLVIEVQEASHVNEIQLQEIDARVKEIKPLTDKVMLLHLQTPRTNRLRFLAGQSVALSIGDDASDYAIASCPCDDRNLQFNIRNIPGNAFAAHVFGDLRSNDTVNVYGPVGEFVLKAESARPLLLLACNSGFAPIKSLIEHAMSLERAESLHLYWLATVQEGHYMANWCRAWNDALDNYHYHELLADSLQAPNLDQMMAQVITEQPNLSQFDVYVAGPSRFITNARTALLQNGVPSAQLASAVI